MHGRLLDFWTRLVVAGLQRLTVINNEIRASDILAGVRQKEEQRIVQRIFFEHGSAAAAIADALVQGHAG